MKATNCFFITRREFPSDEKIISSKLLIKSGMIYKNENGIYSYLPFGLKVIENIKKIVREEMNIINANEVLMPSIISNDVFENSDRNRIFDKEQGFLCRSIALRSYPIFSCKECWTLCELLSHQWNIPEL